MEPLDIAQTFIERALAAPCARRVTDSFRRTVDDLGFRYFACASHVDPLHPARAVMELNYPREYVQLFSDSAWHRIDPVFLTANQTSTPFRWNSPSFLRPLSREQRLVLKEAKRFGLTNGFTIPIASSFMPGTARASCSVVPDSPSIARENYVVVQIISCYLFESIWSDLQRLQPLQSPPPLTRREAQCLQLAAEGKDQWTIGRLLNISHSTVHTHIQSAKAKLGTADTAQAVAKALLHGLIRFGDLRQRPRTER